MKFWDILKISLHNIFNNKLRTFLVMIVLFVLSTIILIVASVGINFTQIINSEDSFGGVNYADLQLGYRMQYSNPLEEGQVKCFSKQDIMNYKSTFKEDYPFLQNMVATSENEFINVPNHYTYIEIGMIDTNENILAGRENYLKAGRLWNKDDADKPNIWINDVMAEEFKIGIGDTIDVEFYTESRYTGSVPGKTCKFVVTGIVDYQDYEWAENNWVLFDYNYALSNGAKINTLKFSQSKLSDGASISMLNKLKSFIKQNNTFDYEKNPTGLSVISYAVEDRNFAILFTSLIIIGVLVISVIIILLSIGCVSNSIQITVEQNAKFFGMMKAIGMRNSVVKSIVQIQSIIMIFIAVCLATGVAIGLFFGINPILAQTFASLGLTISLSMPFYIPIVVFAILVGMVILFTLKSLNKISKMDVVSVISEVN